MKKEYKKFVIEIAEFTTDFIRTSGEENGNGDGEIGDELPLIPL